MINRRKIGEIGRTEKRDREKKKVCNGKTEERKEGKKEDELTRQ